MQAEKTPLLNKSRLATTASGEEDIRLWTRIASVVTEYLRMVLDTILAGPRFLVAGLYDESGQFAWRSGDGRARRKAGETQGADETTALSEKRGEAALSSAISYRRDSAGSTLSSISDEDELSQDMDRQTEGNGRTAAGSTPKRNQSGDAAPKDSSNATAGGSTEEVTPRRSTRIKIAAGQDGPRRRATRREAPEALSSQSGKPNPVLDAMKSPTSPKESSARITRYPRPPAPPRPLIPQRRASFAPHAGPLYNPSHKTLILDLDETLIHSMSKGGRMGEGLQVEVRLKTSVGASGAVIGPQVPILYYVNKRPYCDEFLRKVSKWYNLIIFTASVQEYADPVIDILEQERKYFSGRYYRQHCTWRAGAYVKDLSQIEPDLSRVIILDNSPVSYIFHEDNAIPIEGWINDPEDSCLLHLIPLFEGLQHTTDVRALLALRLGETVTSGQA